GVVWIVVGSSLGKDFEALIGFGSMMVFLGLIFTIAFFFRPRSRRLRNWQDSGLVIGPIGLALVQGATRGELRWDELRKIQYPNKPQFFTHSYSDRNLYGIGLVVEGATIVIADVYDKPLEVIHRRLLALWEGEPEDEIPPASS